MKYVPLGVALSILGLALGCQRAAEEPTPRPRSEPAPVAPAASVVAPAVATVAPAPSAIASAAPTCPADPDKGGPKLATHKMTIVDAHASLEAEVVSTSKDSERGLMYRTSMPEGHGMLFKLERKEQVFWMHNTCIPLDMLFVEESGKIVGILENVPILNDEPRSVGLPSVYVLEMNAGWCKTHGVKVGQTLALPDPVKKLVVK